MEIGMLNFWSACATVRETHFNNFQKTSSPSLLFGTLGMFKILEEKYITWNDLQHWSWNWNFYFAFVEFASYDQPQPLCRPAQWEMGVVWSLHGKTRCWFEYWSSQPFWEHLWHKQVIWKKEKDKHYLSISRFLNMKMQFSMNYSRVQKSIENWSVCCKMALGEVGVSLPWWYHALVLLAPG